MSVAGSGGGRVGAGSGAGAGVVDIDWLAGGWAGSGRVGVGVGWSVTGTLVFLVSIGPDLTFRLFFDGIVVVQVVWELIRLWLVPSIVVFCKQSKKDALSTVWEPRVVMVRKTETRIKASTVGERVAMVVPPRTE